VFASLAILSFLPMLLRQTSSRAASTDRVSLNLVPLVAADTNPVQSEDIPPQLEIIEMPEIIIPKPEALPPLQIETPAIPKVAAMTVAVPPSSGNDTAPVRSGVVKTSQRARYDIGEVDRKPRGAVTVKPAYPYRARKMSIEGYVTVRFLVDQTGATRELTILEANPRGVFEPEVLKTLPKWRFEPAQKDGRVVETWVKTTIEFRLKG
jgi:protein TonB